MMADLLPTPIEWQAIGSVTAAAVLIVAAVFARQQVLQAREARTDQNRPFVVVDLDWQSRRPLLNLIIENVGHTVARDVRFGFTPELESTLYDDPPIAELHIFREGLRTLPPGKRIVVLFDSSIQRNSASFENLYEVQVDYSSDSDAEYSDEYAIDLNPMWGARYSEPKGLEDVARSLEAIAKEIRKWSSNLGRGVLVRDREEEAAAFAEDAARAEERE